MTWQPLPDRVTLEFTAPSPRKMRIRPESALLVLVDMQRFYCEPSPKWPSDAAERAQLIVRPLAELLQRARSAGVQVVHVRSLRRSGSPLSGARGWPVPDADDDGAAFIDELAPLAIERVIDKPGCDPFALTELELYLRTGLLLPTRTTVLVTGSAVAGSVNAACLGFSDRHYLTLVPMDCQAGLSIEEELRTYDQYQFHAYSYNTAFTLSTLVDFSSTGLLSLDLAQSLSADAQATSSESPRSNP